jgi:hypothetical protein
MFEAKLKGQIERIFGIKKVTFDLPGESKEQEGVFIQVETLTELSTFSQLMQKFPTDFLQRKLTPLSRETRRACSSLILKRTREPTETLSRDP